MVGSAPRLRSGARSAPQPRSPSGFPGRHRLRHGHRQQVPAPTACNGFRRNESGPSCHARHRQTCRGDTAARVNALFEGTAREGTDAGDVEVESLQGEARQEEDGLDPSDHAAQL